MGLELVSIHFPKAAGTSFAHGLKNHFGDGLALDYAHDPVDPGHDLNEPPILPEGARAVHGHFRADRYCNVSNAYRVTFLREPVDNLISIYYFWLVFPSIGNATHDRFLSERPTIFDFAKYPRLSHLLSETYFGNVDLRKFDFVGFYERRATDLSALSSELGIAFDGELHVNRTASEYDAERREILDSKPAVQKLKSILADDVVFYQKALEFWS